MSKANALQQLNSFFTAGMIDQAKHDAKVARIGEIAINRAMHPATKNNRYMAVVEMTKHGM